MRINNFIIRLVVTILLFSIFCLLVNVNAYAISIDTNQYKPSDVSDSDTGNLTEKAGRLLGIIRNIGAVASVVCLMIIGIKYMLGSVEEKAEFKKSAKPYLIGMFFLFSTTVILTVIQQIMANID